MPLSNEEMRLLKLAADHLIEEWLSNFKQAIPTPEPPVISLARDGRPVTFEEALECEINVSIKPLNCRALAVWARDWEREHGQRAMPTSAEINARLGDMIQSPDRFWYGWADGFRDALHWLRERDRAQKGE